MNCIEGKCNVLERIAVSSKYSRIVTSCRAAIKAKICN